MRFKNLTDMTRPIVTLIGRSSLIGLIALGGASVTADNAEKLVPDPAVVSEPVVQVWGARTRGAKGLFGVHTWVAVKPAEARETSMPWRASRVASASAEPASRV